MSANPTTRSRIDGRLIWIVATILFAFAMYGTRELWRPHFDTAVAYLKNETPQSESGDKATDAMSHDESASGHVAHDDVTGAESPDSIKLTEAAWTNIGLITGVVETSNFARSKKIPAMVVERPGRSLVHVPAPVTGVVTKVFVVERDSVKPGQPIFELRLTHEDVVTAQSNFIEHLHHKEIEKQKLDRLKAIGPKIIAGNRIIAQRQKYSEETEKVEALRQGLLMHGLCEAQVANIEKTGEFLRKITVVAPPFDDPQDDAENAYRLRKLEVSRGAIVEAGHTLAVLADHSLLFVEGQAFEDDAESLFSAAAAGTQIKVVPSSAGKSPSESLELEIQSVSDSVDTASRALKFYLLLPNEKISGGDNNEKFLGWKYRPGQRMEASLATAETYENNFVLPAEAVVIDGPNAFIFEQNGDNFDRVDVSVLYRDKDSVVVKRDNRLLGSVIAMTAAFDMHLAMKNAAAGPIDPHAGHTH